MRKEEKIEQEEKKKKCIWFRRGKESHKEVLKKKLAAIKSFCECMFVERSPELQSAFEQEPNRRCGL